MAFGRKVYRLLEHPLLLLLIGTILTTWLVPVISARVDRKKLIQEKSQEEATKIIQDSQDVNRALNGMQVTLEFFYKNNRQGPFQKARHYAAAQQKTLADLQDQYKAFDKLAWWWPRDIRWEASFLDFMSEDKLKQIQADGDAYTANLSECMDILDRLWDDLLRKPFDPRNPSLQAEVKETRDKLDKLQAERSDLTSQFVHVFIPW